MFRIFIALIVCTIFIYCANSAYIKQYTKPWKDGRIRYSIQIHSNFSAFNRDIRRVMDDIESELCVKFIDVDKNREEERKNVVDIVMWNGCWSIVGKYEGQGRMSFGWGCHYDGTIRHELLHLLGQSHEQQRPDRDDHIVVDLSNVRDVSLDSWKKFKNPMQFETPFDEQSACLYNPWANPKMSLRPIYVRSNPLNVGMIVRDQIKDFSFWDFQALNKFYKCADKCREPPKDCKPPNYVNQNCKCVTRENFATRRCFDRMDRVKNCTEAATDKTCRNEFWHNDVVNDCRKSCGLCYKYGEHGNEPRPKPRCSDLIPKIECEDAKAKGECETNPKVRHQCERTCGFKCYEIYDRPLDNQCRDVQTPYYCEYQKLLTSDCPGSTECLITCGKCKPPPGYKRPVPLLPCQNYKDDLECDRAARSNKCNRNYYKQYCKGSCGICGKGYPRRKRIGCENAKFRSFYFCNYMKKNLKNYCSTDEAKAECWRTCGYCTPTDEDSKETTTTKKPRRRITKKITEPPISTSTFIYKKNENCKDLRPIKQCRAKDRKDICKRYYHSCAASCGNC